MHITNISVSNFLGLKRFKLMQPGKWNVVTGENGAGKSSVLKAIKEAFKSETGAEAKIHIDAEKAEILVELTGGISVKRTITSKAHGVKVTNGDQVVDKPQGFLDSIIGSYIFNPIEFIDADEKVQRDLLLSALSAKITPEFILDQFNISDQETIGYAKTFFSGLDFNDNALKVISDVAKRIYDSRYVVNQEITRLKKAVEQDKLELPKMVDGDFKDFNVDTKRKELEEFILKESHIAASQVNLEALRARATKSLEEIARLESALEMAKADLEQTREAGKAMAAEVEKMLAENYGEKITALRVELRNYDTYRDNSVMIENIKRRENDQMELAIKHENLNNWHKMLTGQLPTMVMQSQTSAITGLEFTDDGVTYNGVVIGNLSTAEQIKLSLAIAKSLSGKLKIVCIDGFEALSEKSQAEFIEATKDDEFEYFITKVASGDLKVESTAGSMKPPSAPAPTVTKVGTKKSELGF